MLCTLHVRISTYMCITGLHCQVPAKGDVVMCMYAVWNVYTIYVYTWICMNSDSTSQVCPVLHGGVAL